MRKFDSVVSISETSQMFWDENGPLYNIKKRTEDRIVLKDIWRQVAFYHLKKTYNQIQNRLSGKIGFVKIPKEDLLI